MNVAAFIAKRIAFNRQRSFSRFIIRLALCATVISVAVMIATLAMVNGFQEVVSQKVFSFWGHIRVQHFEPSKVAIAEELPIRKNDTVINSIRSHPEVETVQAFGTRYAILKLKNNENIEGVLIKGVEKDFEFSRLNSFLKEGRWIKHNDSGYSNEIVVSSYTAEQLQVKPNDTLIVFFIQSDGSAPRARPLIVSGIFKTSIEEYDKAYAIADLNLLRRLNGWEEDDIGGYEIFLSDYKNMDSVSLELFEDLPLQWDSRTIRDIYPNIFDWLNIQDLNKAVVIIIMIIVAIINLVTCLIILVLERTRMIGLLKAIGAGNWMVQKIFLYQATLITTGGILIGLVLGLGLCWIQDMTGFIRMNEDAYYMASAPVKIIWWQVGAVAGGTLVVCFLTLIIPTLIIRMISPVKAMRFR
ncbi:MAG TPA: FtsX-like permease family protein [Parasegetibacter sp.]